MNYDHILISQQFKYNSSLVKVAISLTKNENQQGFTVFETISPEKFS